MPDSFKMLQSSSFKDYGKGWLTGMARDYARIAISCGVVGAKELAVEITKIQKSKGLASTPTVERAIDNLK